MALRGARPPGYGMAYRHHREARWEAGTVPLSPKPVCGSVALFVHINLPPNIVLFLREKNKTGN